MTGKVLLEEDEAEENDSPENESLGPQRYQLRDALDGTGNETGDETIGNEAMFENEACCSGIVVLSLLLEDEDMSATFCDGIGQVDEELAMEAQINLLLCANEAPSEREVCAEPRRSGLFFSLFLSRFFFSFCPAPFSGLCSLSLPAR